MNQESVSLRQQLIRHQMVVRAAGVTVAAVLVILIGLMPLFRSASTLLGKIDTRNKELTLLTQKVAVLSQIDQEVLKQRTQVIKRALPENKDVIAYLSAVDGLSRELGLSFGGITVAPGEVSGTTTTPTRGSRASRQRQVSQLNVLDTDIKITGNRDGIYAFLRQVEQTLPLMQVTNVTVDNIQDDLFSMTLSLGMLWSPSVESDLRGKIELFTESEEQYFQRLNVFRTYSANTAGIVDEQTGEAVIKPNLFQQD